MDSHEITYYVEALDPPMWRCTVADSWTDERPAYCRGRSHKRCRMLGERTVHRTPENQTEFNARISGMFEKHGFVSEQMPDGRTVWRRPDPS